MKKNYVVFDVNGIIKKQYIANLVATSADVDVIYILADFDKASSESAFRCYARVQRPDGFIVGPVSMPTGVITQEEADELGVDYLNCRTLTLSSTMMALEGTIQVTIVYDQLDIYGKVTATMATGKIVANVKDAVETILTEDEIAELKAQFLPRDLSEITLADDLDDASLVLGQQDGITKRIGMLLVKEYIQESTIVNLGTIASFAELNIIKTPGMYRFVESSKVHMLIVSDDIEAIFQTVFDNGRILYRTYDGANWSMWSNISFETLKADIANIQSNLSTLNTFKDNTVPTTYATKIALNAHISATGNPHNMQKSDLGLGNVENKDSATIRSEITVDDIPELPQSKITNLTNDLGLKANESSLASLFKSVTYNSADGKLTFTQYNDSTVVIDLPLELIVISGAYDGLTQTIILTLANGDTIDIPVGDLLTELNNKVNALETGKVDKVVGKDLVDNEDIAQITTNKNDIININTNIGTINATLLTKVDEDFSAYETGSIEDSDLILLNKGGIPKKNTISALAAKISSETGTFVPSADYSAQGLGAATAVKDSEGNIIKDTYLKKGTSVLNIVDVKTHTLDSNPINETVKVVSVNGETQIIDNVIKNSNPTKIISKSNNLFDGTLFETFASGYDLDLKNLEIGETYTVSFETSDWDYRRSQIRFLDINNNLLDNTPYTTAKIHTFVIPDNTNKTILRVEFTEGNRPAQEIFFENSYIQLNEGETALLYQPYAEHEIALPDLSVHFPYGLGRLPNGVYDEVGVKRTNKITLTGLENNWIDRFNVGTGNPDYAYFSVDIANLNIATYSPEIDTFITTYFGKNSGHLVDDEYIYIQPGNNRIFVKILVSRIGNNSINDFKTWLQSNNIEIIYQLETPIPTGITLPNVPTYDRGHIEIDEGRMSLEIPVDITSQVNVNSKEIHDIKKTTSQNKTLLDATIVDVNSNKNKIASIENDIVVINQDVEANATEITSIKGRVSDLESKEQLKITDTFVVNSSAAMLALDVQTGDVCVRTDLRKTFILKGTDPANIEHWQELLTSTDSVLSVNDKTGVINLTQDDIPSGETNKVFTAAEKTKLSNIESGAQVNVIEDVKVNGASLPKSGKAVDVKLFDILFAGAPYAFIESEAVTIVSGATLSNYKSIEIEWNIDNSLGRYFTKVTINDLFNTYFGGFCAQQSDRYYFKFARALVRSKNGTDIEMGDVHIGDSWSDLSVGKMNIYSIKGWYI